MAHKTDADFQADFDAQTLADGAAIRSDPDRLARAQSAAGGLVTDAQKTADAARKRASAMVRLAKAKKPTTRRGTVGASRGPRARS